MFEGQPAQFHQSLRKLAALPLTTRVFAAHEYTVGNLAFAAALQPDHVPLAQALAAARVKRAQGLATLPSTIGWERLHNPFLRCEEPALAAAVGLAGDSGAAVFAAVRRAKDVFRSA